MKILSIGNSFSQDAQRYLHQLAKQNGVEMKCVNLYIGGCPLKTHYYNILEDSKSYAFQFNGESTGIKVTIKEVLMSDSWDCITLQQASRFSPNYKTYQPYLGVLADYVRKYCTESQLLIHQTWAYEENSERLCQELGYPHAKDMFEDLKGAYAQAAKDITADGIIPCGEVFMTALERGLEKIHRDTFHADLGIGRYALALTWYAYLTKNDPLTASFDGFDVPVDPEQVALVKQVVKDILG